MPKISSTMKRDIIIIVIGYLLIDILVIGAFFVTIINLNNPDLFLVLQNLMPNITNPLNTIKCIILSGSDFVLFLKLSWYFFILILVLSIVYYFKNKDRYDFQGIEHGSSEWSKDGEEFNKLSDGTEILNKKDGFIISRKHFIGTDQRKVKINKNILVVGGSGSGKTACYVKPNILQKLGSYVMTDPKGELFRETSGYLKDNGYKIMTLNLIDTEYSDRYNPLSHIKDHSDVDIIAQTIVMGNEKSGKSNDPFWDNTAKMLLKACIYYVISVLPEEEQNLSSCLNIVRAGGSDETLLDRLFIDELKPDHPGRKEYESIRLGADKTKQSIAISLVSKLSHFDTPNIQKVTTTNDFDFELLGREKVAIYVITPPDTDTYDYILTVFFSQLLQRLFSEASKRGGALKQPVYLLLDEFANIGQIPSFEKKLSVTRSYGISISIVVQSLDQLEALYKDNYENILGNCDTHLFLGSQSLKTCEYFSKSLGQKTIKYYSKSINKDKKEKEKQGVSLSEQRQGRELMTVDEIKRLDPEDEIILIRGLKPIKAKKYWYFKFHPQKDIVSQTIIHDISEMVKPEDIKICTMNVEEHFENRNKSVESNKKQVENVENFKEVEDTKPIEEEYDLQKELEKKFDELFGENANN